MEPDDMESEDKDLEVKPEEPEKILVVDQSQYWVSLASKESAFQAFVALAGFSLAMSKNNPSIHLQTVRDFEITLDPFLPSKIPTFKPCLVCGKQSQDGEDFCSAKHATSYYQSQKAGAYKGDQRWKPRSKRKKKSKQ